MQLLSELRRRNVFRVAAAYVVVGWLLVQASDVIFPRLGLPEWTVTFIILLVALGLPLALFLAWAYELTPEGVRRSAEAHPAEAVRPQTGRRLDWVILAGAAAAIGFDIWTRELAPVAAAQRALGRQEALAETLLSWRDRLAFMRSQGYDFSAFRFIEASYLALAGERDEALAALAEMHDDPTFQSQVARMIELINAERAELGMEPLTR